MPHCKVTNLPWSEEGGSKHYTNITGGHLVGTFMLRNSEMEQNSEEELIL